jgi:alanine dehydrogenase
MKIRYITEDDVAATLDVATTIGLLDRAARAQAAGEAMSMPRQRPRTGRTTLQVLPAAYDGRLAHKTYITGAARGGVRFWVTLFDAQAGTMLAIIEADVLGQIRTGAASGLATRHLARPDAQTGAVIGAGRQAATQLEAICLVRPLERVRVYSRTPERTAAFCAQMRTRVRATIEQVADGETAVRGADIICTMTNASEPVVHGAWLSAGAHINAAGSNRGNAAEIDAETVRRASIVVIEDLAQAKVESGDLLLAEREGAWEWSRAIRLADVVAGTAPGRTAPDQITLFESLGIGLWDIAAASYVYDRCVETNRGKEVEL